jgi:hypothetical protein
MTADENDGWVVINEENMLVYDLAHRLGMTKEELDWVVSESLLNNQVPFVNLIELEELEKEGKTGATKTVNIEYRVGRPVRMLPAAAIPKYTEVRIEGHSFTIMRIENSTPEPGKITWHTDEELEEVVGGNQQVEVLRFP